MQSGEGPEEHDRRWVDGTRAPGHQTETTWRKNPLDVPRRHLEKELLVMSICLHCKKETKTLTARITETYTVRLADDWEDWEKKELRQADLWPSREGKALGYVQRKDVRSKYEYYCPKCGSLLFTTAQAALDFLMS
jgi:hypothetical protein